MKQDTKERLSLRLSPLTSYRLHTAYKSAGFRSMNELAEQAITFYLDYLDVGNAGDFLPMALKSYLDGRLGKLEDRLSALSFRQSVETDMVVGVLADSFQFSEEDLRRRRTESINNVSGPRITSKDRAIFSHFRCPTFLKILSRYSQRQEILWLPPEKSQAAGGLHRR